MARPDFTKIWAGSRSSIPEIAGGSYAAGWDTYLGPLPPLADDHDYVMNLQDERAVWLSGIVDSVRIDVASAATVDLAALAEDTRAIRITGTTAITGFAVTAGATYFVTFAAALTLTNGASLVTQTGANILTAAGDTCIIRATAANVVEVMVYVDATVQSLTANGHRRFKDGLIIQWGSYAGGAHAPTTLFPAAFPNAVFSVLATSVEDNSSVAVTSAGLSSFAVAQLVNGVNSSSGFYWMAAGY